MMEFKQIAANGGKLYGLNDEGQIVLIEFYEDEDVRSISTKREEVRVEYKTRAILLHPQEEGTGSVRPHKIMKYKRDKDDIPF